MIAYAAPVVPDTDAVSSIPRSLSTLWKEVLPKIASQTESFFSECLVQS